MVEKKINIEKLLRILDTHEKYEKSVSAVEIVVGKIQWQKTSDDKT
jgi:hypothetical protein